ERLPLSRLDLPAEDDGFAGARLATTDNQTTGQFLGHSYGTSEATATPENAVEKLDELLESGAQNIAIIAPAETVLALADHAAGRDVLLFNASAPNDRLRN